MMTTYLKYEEGLKEKVKYLYKKKNINWILFNFNTPDSEEQCVLIWVLLEK